MRSSRPTRAKDHLRLPLSGPDGQLAPSNRIKAWLVTGPLGRGLAFAIDFAVAVRRGLLRRRRAGNI
jgi:hypothetical protein